MVYLIYPPAATHILILMLPRVDKTIFNIFTMRLRDFDSINNRCNFHEIWTSSCYKVNFHMQTLVYQPSKYQMLFYFYPFSCFHRFNCRKVAFVHSKFHLLGLMDLLHFGFCESVHEIGSYVPSTFVLSVLNLSTPKASVLL